MMLQTLTRRAFPAIALLILSVYTAYAKEGMWLPPQIGIRAADMQAMGLKIPVDQLYNKEGTGLNNAVVLFGKGCTGEVISSKGLVLTNHHCGYGTVQGLSSPQHDYFANGFWAMSMSEELPCPGLTVTFVRDMQNVSGEILTGLQDTLAPRLRDTVIAQRIRNLERHYKEVSGLDASIQPFYGGNQYWVILSETYRDLRLVGFPPNGIGQFGGDTDNWMWPRHNADFSMFRIYADAKGKPADYNAANKPYEPKRFFSISTAGYKEGDFTMVYGFPGTTQEYIASPQLNQIQNISDPIRIAVRDRKLAIWKDAANADREVFLKYTSKIAGIANGWKKWQGEVRGLMLNNVAGKKMAQEDAFQAWAAADTTLPYADNLLPQITAAARNADSALKAEEYMREAVFGIELIAQGAGLNQALLEWRSKKSEAAKQTALRKIADAMDGFFKNYDRPTDQKVFAALMPMFVSNNPKYVPRLYRTLLEVNKGDYERWASNAYQTSLLTHPEQLGTLLRNGKSADTARILSDPTWQLYNAATEVREQKILPELRRYQERLAVLNRLYMNAQMQQHYGRQYYSDATLTLRIAYGQVKGIDPDGPAGYSYQTNLNEVMAKDRPGDPEFSVPQQLKDVYASRKYGRWAIQQTADGSGMVSGYTVPVAFIADNHTTGGNSGSPVLNAKGELIGTNFDRIWEGTMSDLYFDPNLSRNISVDIRYTLFVVDKIGGAGWLLKEMRLVK